ncbi:hypothetical protein V8F20_008762 [Naviculisporaceae sp. PSN 640]
MTSRRLRNTMKTPGIIALRRQRCSNRRRIVGPGAKPPPRPARQQMVKPSGKTGKSGIAGKTYDAAGAQFCQARVNLKMVATEDEMLDVMAPVDWRFYSE